MEHYDIIIVGSGPAGISTALSLQKIAPDLAAHTLVIEKARHPRPKLCGGGVTIVANPLLNWLDIGWERLGLSFVPIHSLKLRFEDQEVVARLSKSAGQPLFRIIRRDEFDARLVAIARERGIAVQEETPLTGLRRVDGAVLLETPRGRLQAKAVVGADGSKSLVRRWMGLAQEARPSRVARLLEALTPEDAAKTPEFRENFAVFDFSRIPDGVQGYLWDFPSIVNGRAMTNRDVFDSRILADRPRAKLVPALAAYLAGQQRNLAEVELQGHPERIYDPRGRYAAPHMLLAGDAAGVDPLLGEGIAWALRYGPVAAETLRLAHETGDFSFSDYDKRLRRRDVGRGLSQRIQLARFCYGRSRSFIRLAWPLLGPFSRYLAWLAERSLLHTGIE